MGVYDLVGNVLVPHQTAPGSRYGSAFVQQDLSKEWKDEPLHVLQQNCHTC